jgi:hypothetical protein
MTAPKHIDHILVHWGEDVIWQERKPVMRSRDDSLAVLMRLGKTLGRGVSPQKGLTPQAVRDHLVGLVRASPQVMVKIMGGGSDMKHIGAHFDYIARVGHFKKDNEPEIELETDDGLVVRDKADRAMLKEFWRLAGVPIPQEIKVLQGPEVKSTKPIRAALNIVLSMSEGANRENVKAAARATAKEQFENHQFVMAHHGDTANPHTHLVVKMIGFDGQRLKHSLTELTRWRIAFAKHLNALGVEAVATRRSTRFERQRSDSTAVRKMKESGVLPQRIKEMPKQSAAKTRALTNEEKARTAYLNIAQALLDSSEQSDKLLGKELYRWMQQHGVEFKLAPKLRIQR